MGGGNLTSCVMYGFAFSRYKISAMSFGFISTRISHHFSKSQLGENLCLRLAESKRRPSTPNEMRSFVYAASRDRTYSVSVAKLTHDEHQVVKVKGECVLCKAHELACPHFHCVAIIDNVVVGLETTMVEILERVDSGIVIMGEGCSYNRSARIGERGIGSTNGFPQRPPQNLPLSYGSI
jgi:NAD-dependent dihydropyrimidine dehydrogenase PreA subunit